MANVLILAILMRDKNAPPQTAPSNVRLSVCDGFRCNPSTIEPVCYYNERKDTHHFC